jgi:hypothetical protein
MLIYRTTNQPLKVGDIVHFGRTPCIITYTPMGKSALAQHSSPALWLETMDELKVTFRANPESIGATWTTT